MSRTRRLAAILAADVAGSRPRWNATNKGHRQITTSGNGTKLPIRDVRYPVAIGVNRTWRRKVHFGR